MTITGIEQKKTRRTLHLKVTTGQDEQKNLGHNSDQVIKNKRHDKSKKEGVGEIQDETRQKQNKFVQNLAKTIFLRQKISND